MENTQEEKAKLLERNNFKLCSQALQWGALYRPKKGKGRPSDLTHEKTTQKFWKYNSNIMQVLETKLKKVKVMLLCLVSPPQRYSDKFIELSRIFGVPKWSSIDIYSS